MLDRDLWTLYEFFLLKGTNELKTSALRLALPHIREHEPFELKLTGRQVKRIAKRTLRWAFPEVPCGCSRECLSFSQRSYSW